MLQCKKWKIIVLYTFLAILNCNFIKGMKGFTIIISYKQTPKNYVWEHLKYISYYIIHFCGQNGIKLQKII